jgi:hypothetical protein
MYSGRILHLKHSPSSLEKFSEHRAIQLTRSEQSKQMLSLKPLLEFVGVKRERPDVKVSSYTRPTGLDNLDLSKYASDENMGTHGTCLLANDVEMFGIYDTKAKNTTFKVLSELLRDEKVVELMRLMIVRCGMILNGGVYDKTNDQTNDKNYMRTFLVSYMIAYKPGDVFESEDHELEKDLHNKAVDMLKVLEKMRVRMLGLDKSADPSDSMKKTGCEARTLHLLMNNYIDAFKRWKVQDQIKIISRIKH